MKRLNIIMGAAALAAVCMTASINLNAQDDGNRDEFGNIVRGPYETNRFGDNWFIGAGGGINIFLNDGYGIRISPSIDAGFGKWFTPSVGMRIGYQGIYAQTWADNATILGPSLDQEKGKYGEKFGYMYIHSDFLWNISNALSGYKETRFWNLIPYAHAGFFRSYGMDGIDYSDNSFAMGAGLLHNLRLTERLDLVIDMRATVVDGSVHASSGVAVLPSVTMGMAVDLGWPAFTRTSTIIGALETANAEKSAILEAGIVALEAANATLAQSNEKLKKQNKELNREINNLKTMPPAPEFGYEAIDPMMVFFEIGQAVLNEKEMQHLDFFAKNILTNADNDSQIYITLLGSADGNTGTPARNKYLSEARGKYVMDLLTDKYGMDPDRLTIRSEVVQKSEKPELSRAVIISF
jgi:outer membrane protein OmpA-like peptidoglycan-associated protein